MAFSSSSLFRLNNAKCIIGSSSSYCMLGKWSARFCASLFNLRPLTTARETVSKQESSPWLMLQPEIEAGTTSYKFYSLDDNKVQTLCPIDKIRDLRLTCCRGSSHGWLALLSPHNYDFILYNPISRRQINLPSVPYHDDFFPYKDILDCWTVSKVILSCSPDDEENCRVFIIRGWENALAFCCPGRSKEWTLMFDEQVAVGLGLYDDCVYSTRLKLFFALDSSTGGRGLETWDLGDPSSPKLIKVDKMYLENCNYCFMGDTFLWYSCETKEHLVVAKEDLLLVVQYIMDDVGRDGLCFHHLDERNPGNSRHMTIGFDIFKYDSEKGKLEYLDSSSLGDLAIFVGTHSHSVAIQATEFPGVKPNSFTLPMHTAQDTWSVMSRIVITKFVATILASTITKTKPCLHAIIHVMLRV